MAFPEVATIPRAETRWAKIARLGIVFFLIFAAKLWVIRQYGSSVPLYDQWSGEAWKMYEPFLEGNLHVSDLFAGHNEHRIFFSRLLFLLLLKINGLWEPLLEMVVQAALHAAVLTLFIWLCLRHLSARYGLVFIIATSPLWLLPFGWENTLSGFQSQFYFVSLFGILTLWLAWRHDTLSLGWWFCLLTTVAGWFSMAGGIFAAAAAAALMLARVWTDAPRWKRHLTGFAILAAMTVGGYLLVPHVPEHDVFRARSIGELLGAFLSTLSWPFEGCWACLILQAPFVMVGLCMLRRRTPSTDPAWFLLAFGAWGWLQALAIAYGRANITLLAPRYLDAFCITLGASLACLCVWATRFSSAYHRKTATILLSGWVFILMTCSLWHYARHTSSELKQWSLLTPQWEDSLKNYLETHDAKNLTDRPLPFPDAAQLKTWLDDPTIAGILPARLHPQLRSSRQISEDSFSTRSYFDNGGKPPPDGLRYWSSYTTQGVAQRGQMDLRFASLKQTHWLEIFVAGQPGSSGMSLVLTDRNGQTHNLAPFFNPGLEWKPVLVKIPPGAFSILAKDDRSDAWLALSNPREVGIVAAMVERFSDFCLDVLLPLLIAGGVGYFILVLLGVLPRPGNFSTATES